MIDVARYLSLYEREQWDLLRFVSGKDDIQL